MAEESERDITVRRAYQVYLYAVCFVTVLVVLVTAAQAAYGIVRIAAPGVTSETGDFGENRNLAFGFDPAEAERDRGTRDLIQNGIIAVIAGGVFAFHWRLATRLRRELEGELETQVTAGLSAPQPPPEEKT